MGAPNYFARQLYATVFLLAAPMIVCSDLWLRGPPDAGQWIGAALLAAVLTVYGYNVGSHYTFTHRLFRYPRPIELALIYTSTISAAASPLSWAVHHIAHHRYADTEHDPHAPCRLGWRAALTACYATDKADPMAVRHLLRDPAQRFADSNVGFWAITASWPLLAAAVGGLDGLVYFWLLPVWYVLAVAMAFVFSHTGPHDERSGARAVNSPILGLLSLGDGDHLEHHRNMRSCGRGTRFFARLLWPAAT